MGVPSLTS